MIENGIHGNCKKILKYLLLSPIERDCHELRRVFTQNNFDENIPIEILLDRSNKQIKAIISSYFESKLNIIFSRY